MTVHGDLRRYLGCATNHAGQQIIDHEDKKNPLSDQALSDALKLEGYVVARRTVSKYREQLNEPVARLRKQII